MISNDTEKRRSFIINFTYFLIIAAIVFTLVKYGVPLLAPFILAFIVAGLLQKPIRFMHRKLRIKKKLCGLAAALLFFMILAALVYLGGGGVITGLQRLLINMPQFYNKTIEPMMMDMFNNLESMELWNDMHLMDLLRDLESQIMDTLGNVASSISKWAVSEISDFATSLPMMFVKLVLFIIGTVFISMDYDKIMGFCIRQMNDRTRELFFEVKAYIVGTLLVVIRSYILIMTITFVELSIGLSIIGIKNAIIIALCIAIFDILPVLGTGGIMIPWTVISVVLGNYAMAASLFVLYVIITIIRNIVEPKIVGSQLGLHPIVTLSSMFAGAQLLGAIGLFGFPITLSLAKHLNDKGVISILRR